MGPAAAIVVDRKINPMFCLHTKFLQFFKINEVLNGEWVPQKLMTTQDALLNKIRPEYKMKPTGMSRMTQKITSNSNTDPIFDQVDYTKWIMLKNNRISAVKITTVQIKL